MRLGLVVAVLDRGGRGIYSYSVQYLPVLIKKKHRRGLFFIHPANRTIRIYFLFYKNQAQGVEHRDAFPFNFFTNMYEYK